MSQVPSIVCLLATHVRDEARLQSLRNCLASIRAQSSPVVLLLSWSADGAALGESTRASAAALAVRALPLPRPASEGTRARRRRRASGTARGGCARDGAGFGLRGSAKGRLLCSVF